MEGATLVIPVEVSRIPRNFERGNFEMPEKENTVLRMVEFL